MAVPNAAVAVLANRRKAEDRKVASAADSYLGPLAAVQTIVEFEPLAPILMEGDSVDHLFSIKTGVVKVHRLLADGRCLIYGFLFPGDLLGLTSEDVHLYNAVAVGSVTLSRFPRRIGQAKTNEAEHRERWGKSSAVGRSNTVGNAFAT
jgi:CRP/FNR family transcriptional regulator, anaerobic regulatory protein